LSAPRIYQSTDLYARLGEVDTSRQLLAHKRVRVVGALEDALERRQLSTVERRPTATRLHLQRLAAPTLTCSQPPPRSCTQRLRVAVGRYRRSKQRKSMTSFKLVTDTPLRQLTLTLTVNLRPHFFCTNNAPFATGNKHTANDESRSKKSVVSYMFLNATRLRGGRWQFSLAAV